MNIEEKKCKKSKKKNKMKMKIALRLHSPEECKSSKQRNKHCWCLCDAYYLSVLNMKIEYVFEITLPLDL